MPNRSKYIQHAKLRGEWAELRFMQRATERGFRVAKPWGETAPYDVATDHHGLFRRVQVKCTICRSRNCRNSYVCTISSCRAVYRPDQLDFFAAFVIPTDTWYIVPILATNSQRAIILSPHLEKSKYGPYQEAWHLLMRDPGPCGTDTPIRRP